MRIYLLRHGIAIDHDHPDCPDEPDRYLTEQGIARTKAACRGLAALGLDPDRVVTSPYVRARQTAEIAVAAVGERPLHQSSALLPMADPDRLAAELGAVTFDEALCVGHAPQLDRFIAHVLGVRRPPTQLKKAGVAMLELLSLDPAQGWLAAVYPPKVLRRFGGEAELSPR